jgi:glutathione peroxidase
MRTISLAIAVLTLTTWLALADEPSTQPTTNPSPTTEPSMPAALNFTMKTIDGKEKNLADYQGKVVLMVNVASRCGLTPQYKALQALHEKYAEQGLAILGFPANDFGAQEPGTDEQIIQFCQTNYGVTFDMFSKISVKGEKQHPLYQVLTSASGEKVQPGDITWNFEKFLLDRQGNIVARFSPRTTPDSKEVVEAIEAELARQ